MAEQHQSSDDGKEGQRSDPGRMTDLSKPAEQFDSADRQRQEPITLMLKISESLPKKVSMKLSEPIGQAL